MTSLPMFTIDVCEDCYMYHHGLTERDYHGAPELPLGRYQFQELFDGCTECEPCGHDECSGARTCGCGYGDRGHGFSWSRCDGCLSHLGGNRYPLVVLADDITEGE